MLKKRKKQIAIIKKSMEMDRCLARMREWVWVGVISIICNIIEEGLCVSEEANTTN